MQHFDYLVAEIESKRKTWQQEHATQLSIVEHQYTASNDGLACHVEKCQAANFYTNMAKKYPVATTMPQLTIVSDIDVGLLLVLVTIEASK